MKRLTLLLCVAMLAGLLTPPVGAAQRDRRPDHQANAEEQEGPGEDTREERRAKMREAKRQRREQRREEQRDADTRDEQRRRDVRKERPRGGAEQAARTARSQNGGGRVLSVNPDGDGYRVRLLKDGEVRSYWVKED